MILKTYTLELHVLEKELVEMYDQLAFNAHVSEAEENLSDLLPEGYQVKIREWDEEETPNE